MERGKRSEPAELLAIVLVGLFLKLFAGRFSLTEKGIILPGYDEYYHMRRILYTVSHFPNTLWFDSYLNYPHGFEVTWPPLWDQISAAFSLILGQRTQGGVEMAASIMPVLIGCLAIIVIYYLMKELFSSRVAMLAAFMTALAPTYLLYTMFGAIDHHCLEVLLQLGSILFVGLALSRKEKRYVFAVLAGLTMAALAYTWEGADIYLGIFLIYAAVEMTIDLWKGSSTSITREMTTTLLAAYGVALILVLPFWNTDWMGASSLGLAAMIAALAIMFALSHVLAARRLPWTAFPLGIFVLVVLFALLSTILGGLFGLSDLIHSGISFLLSGEMTGEISEAEPLIYNADTFYTVVFSSLGLNLLFSVAGMAAMVAVIRQSDASRRPGQLLLLIWAIYAIVITFGQARFLYLSTIVIGVLISVLFFTLLDLAKRYLAEKGHKSPTWLPLILLLILVLPTLAETIPFAENTPPAVEGDWYQSLAWLKENSNTTSYFDNPDRNGEYSVMSWWDYGNWILYLSKRPVVANNFQVGADDAARFYLSESEENATAVLDARGSRYVMTDYDMIYGKLPALTTWANESLNTYMALNESGSQVEAVPLKRLFNTTLARLHFFDGAGMSHFRLIYESSSFVGSNPPTSKVKIFEYVPGALIRIKAGQDQRAGVLLNMTSNQGRSFTYVNEATPNNGEYDVRVPYSTDHEYGTYALGPYLVFSGNEKGVKMQNIMVSDRDVLEGRTIEVSF